MDTLKRVMEINTIGKNKKVLKKYAKVWDEVKNQIGTINGDNHLNIRKILRKLGLNEKIVYFWVKY